MSNKPLTQQEVAALAQAEKYRQQTEMMRKIHNPQGFYDYYFAQLPLHRTNVECFNAVNDLYFELFGDYKYSSYNSFQRRLTEIINKK